MKHRPTLAYILPCLLILLAGCVGEAPQGPPVIVAGSPQSGATSTATGTPPARAPTPVEQQPLPKGLLNPAYPVMDWVFNVTCGSAVTSYNASQVNAAIAYDSAAWLFPSDGHLVLGYQSCDQAALMQEARDAGLPTLLTVGVDGAWSRHALAQYIDVAASEPQVPCTPQASTRICQIVNRAVAGGYQGVIIDFELVQQDYPGIAEKFASFMRKLQVALHKQGLLCGLTIFSKVSDNPADDPFSGVDGFQDFRLLSGVDFLIDMALDYDVELNTPGPLTSVNWVEKSVDYLWQKIPQALSKTIFEFPLYGREWQQGASGQWQHIGEDTCAQVMQQRATQSLLSNVASDPLTPEIAWDDASGNRHELWYNTPASLTGIMGQVQTQVRGLLHDPHYMLPTSFWYRGAECPGFYGQGNALEAFYNS